jgi:PAS domain S-box-containing protein
MQKEEHRLMPRLSRALSAGFMLLSLSAATAQVHARSDAGGVPTHLVVGVTSEHEPLESTKDDRLGGFSGELLHQLIGASGTTLEVRIFDRRDDALRATCEGKVDVLVDAVPRNEFTHCLVYSSPYLERAALLVARRDRAGSGEAAFPGDGTIVTERGSAWGVEAAQRFPAAKGVEADGLQASLQAVVDGKADAFVGLNFTAHRMLRDQRFSALQAVRRIDVGVAAFRFAAAAEHAALIHELDRRLADLPDSVVETLRDRWLREDGGGPTTVPLSAVEREALFAHKTLRYTVPRLLPPFSMEGPRGQPEGLTIDFLTQIGRILNVDFLYVPTAGPEAAYAALGDGRVDLIAGAVRGKDAPHGALDAGVYSRVPLVIVTRKDTAYVKSLGGLVGQRVALVREDPMSAVLRARMPPAHIVEVASIEDGLELVNANRADAAIGNLNTMDAMVRDRFWNKLKVAGATGLDEDFGLQTAASLAPLHEVMSRTLASMPELDRFRIERRWTSAVYQFGTPWQDLMRRAWPFIFLVVGIGIAGAISYVRMRRLVALRLKTDARLAHELALKEALLACLPEPVSAKSADYCYMDLNPAFEHFFGIRKADAIGKPISDVLSLPRHIAEEVMALHDAAIASMVPQHTQFQLQNAAGQMRRLVYWVVPFRTPEKAPGGVVTVHFDVTDIDEARERAEMLERRLTDVIDSLPVTVFQTRFPIDGQNDTWEVTYAAGDCIGLGLDPASLVGIRSEQNSCFCREDLPRIHAAIRESARLGRPFEFEARIMVGAGLHWVHVRAVPRSAGGVTVWNGVMSDVTGRMRQAEALRDAKDAAEAALHAKEGFLAMMSHEIRTPMNGVLGLVELLQNTPLDLDQQRMLALARESGEALARILDDILDYAKIEAGRLTISPMPLDLRELFDSVCALLQAQAQKKGLQLRVSVDADVPATVGADGIRMRQILFNLFGNAIKFTDRGSVTLRATVHAREAETATVLVEVQDTGIGIPKEEVQRLFAPFVQSERSSNRRFGGTGLGLAISRRLADMMGGRLTLESEEGVGTTAALLVPCSVLCQGYDLPLLKGRSVAIHVSDTEVADALRAHARAAGMHCVQETSGATLVFADSQQMPSPPATSCVIGVTTKWKQRGFQADEAGVRLSVNPLRWEAFIGAAESALELQAQGATGAVRDKAVAPQHWLSETAADIGARQRILVAEDHRINQEVIRQQLILLGYAPTIVENGKAALEALNAEAFNLVLTDYHMPVMDGFELTRQIREHERETVRRLPVVGITATTVREEHDQCFEVGMDACVLKPTTLASLQSGLASAMRAHEAGAVPAATDDNTARGHIPAGSPAPVANRSGSLHFDPSCVEPQAVRNALNLGDNDAMLRACREALVPDRETLVTLLDRGDVSGLRAWCHRVSGALSLFRQPHVDALLDAFHDIVKSGAMGSIRGTAGAVLDMVDYLLGVLGGGHSGPGGVGEEVSPPPSCRECGRAPDECNQAPQRKNESV